MITEVAHIRIKDGQEAAFEVAIAKAEGVLKQAKGWRGLTATRAIEDPALYYVLIRWDTVDNHMVDFREGPLFAEWRALVGPHFAEVPQVLHFDTVLGFGAAS